MAKKKTHDDVPPNPGDIAGPTHSREAIKLPTRNRFIDFIQPDSDDGDPVPALVMKTQEIEGVPTMHVCAFDPVFGPRNYYVQNAAEAAREGELTERGCWAWPARV